MKLSTLLVFVPVAAVSAILAVANREEVAFRIDPFAAGDSAAAFVMPLFLLVFLSFLLGVLVGGTTIALRRGRKARQERIVASGVDNTLASEVAGRPEPPKS
jgi:MFS superfamily sulfate permease-like transporter